LRLSVKADALLGEKVGGKTKKEAKEGVQGAKFWR